MAPQTQYSFNKLWSGIEFNKNAKGAKQYSAYQNGTKKAFCFQNA